MRLAPLVMMLAAGLALAGCGTASRTYSFTPPTTPGGLMCTDQCRQARGYCQETCDLGNRSCVDDAQAKALYAYDAYTRKQFAAHKSFDLLPRDFENDAPCMSSRTSCYGACEDKYRTCYRNCGGAVDVSTSCQLLCF